ncbi:Isochorismatase family protein [Ruminococcus sp. YE71]|uniref:isochorismatase family protein n=1 Tax=unclassified Ruminococcus TaxID=2608920 RepID=UPI000886CB81|nr:MULTISPECIES: isochorismatase family protein [unclassified Ruminococcus]SDA16021.1 Isochorismatase family protein [Ruminococcus sp. YE78]SFW23735.1 Isochorismatase family protein [Ruminococcus sp. YE71]
MDRVLFIINLQEYYVGRTRDMEKFPFDAEQLIKGIKKRIAEYKPEEVFALNIVGKGLLQKSNVPKAGSSEADVVKDIKIDKKNIYERTKSDVFSNNALLDFIRARNVKEIEFVGVDLGEDIGKSAMTATEDYKLHVYFNEACIKLMQPEKTKKLREKLRKTRVTYMEEW